MGKRRQRIEDKNIYSEFDPKMKNLFDPDKARQKENFDKFKDQVKRIYPNAEPVIKLVAPENCDQCQTRVWTHKTVIVTAIATTVLCKFCDVCFIQAEDICKKLGHRMTVMIKRPTGFYPLAGAPRTDQDATFNIKALG